jgi:hypothetical protein
VYIITQKTYHAAAIFTSARPAIFMHVVANNRAALPAYYKYRQYTASINELIYSKNIPATYKIKKTIFVETSLIL